LSTSLFQAPNLAPNLRAWFSIQRREPDNRNSAPLGAWPWVDAANVGASAMLAAPNLERGRSVSKPDPKSP